MNKITDLRELLKHELEDLYSAEVQLIDALPAMAEKATGVPLQKAFYDHLEATKEHKMRLEKIQKILGNEKATPESKSFFAKLFSSKEGETHCKTMEGLVKEAKSLMGEDMSPEVMDAALIAAAQKVEHYEISSYGTARAFALQLNLTEVAGLLKATLDEEYFADDSLTKLALGGINEKAEAQPKKTAKKTAPKKAAPKKAASKKAAPKKVAKKVGKRK